MIFRWITKNRLNWISVVCQSLNSRLLVSRLLFRNKRLTEQSKILIRDWTNVNAYFQSECVCCAVLICMAYGVCIVMVISHRQFCLPLVIQPNTSCMPCWISIVHALVTCNLHKYTKTLPYHATLHDNNKLKTKSNQWATAEFVEHTNTYILTHL